MSQPIRIDEAAFRKHSRRAETYLAQGLRHDALASLAAAAQANPDDIPTRLKMVDLHLAAGRHNPGRDEALRATSGFVSSPRVALDLVERLFAVGENRLVVEIARQLQPGMWDSAKSLAEMARHLTLLGAHDAADVFATAAVRKDGANPPALFMLATMDVFYGRMEAAAEHCDRCLAILPTDPNSNWLMSRLRLPDAGPRIDRIKSALAASPPADDQVWLWYALHNELHELRDYEGSWQALSKGCATKRALLGYDPAKEARVYDALRGWTADEITRQDGHVDPALAPVFVIGLHRSGTTLAERILSGHPAVKGAGETYELTTALRRASGRHFRGVNSLEVIQERAGLDYAGIGRNYLEGMRWRAGGKHLVTDKLPSNYLNLGFIARALPQARFVHLRRNAIDVGLSNLRTLFNEACPYSYDQLDFAEHHGHYRALMAHWHELLPGRILDLDYDDLVGDPEQSARKLAAFCGLEHDPAMVRIEERKDAVATASSVMMREGIRKDRGGLWQAYAQWLGPMIERLSGIPGYS
ncbi:sulfotransferase [Arenimonas sp.]|uniref:tetratricopeptide repeat-containing sulfotransferase family protein n=1 Tax=Arenimonas sp. TaxID=1872635 RepID=UPI0035B15FDA